MARPKGEGPPRQYINARIRHELYVELVAIAKSDKMTRSQAVERAVEAWLEQRRGGKSGKR